MFVWLYERESNVCACILEAIERANANWTKGEKTQSWNSVQEWQNDKREKMWKNGHEWKTKNSVESVHIKAKV